MLRDDGSPPSPFLYLEHRVSRMSVRWRAILVGQPRQRVANLAAARKRGTREGGPGKQPKHAFSARPRHMVPLTHSPNM